MHDTYMYLQSIFGETACHHQVCRTDDNSVFQDSSFAHAPLDLLSFLSIESISILHKNVEL